MGKYFAARAYVGLISLLLLSCSDTKHQSGAESYPPNDTTQSGAETPWDKNVRVFEGEHFHGGFMRPCLTVLIQTEKGKGAARHFYRQSKNDFSEFLRWARTVFGSGDNYAVFIGAGTHKSPLLEFADFHELIEYFHKAGYRNVNFMKAPAGATMGALGRKPDGTIYYSLEEGEPWELALIEAIANSA